MQFEVGQEVAIDRGVLGYRRYQLAKVSHVTPGGEVVVEYGYSSARFNRNARSMGKNSKHEKLVLATQDVLDAIRKEDLLERLNKIRLKDLPLATLERVVAALEEA